MRRRRPLRSRVIVRTAYVLNLLAVLGVVGGCAAAPEVATFELKSAQIKSAVRTILSGYESFAEDGEILETGWETHSRFPSEPPGVFRREGRYQVRVRGRQVEVWAQVRVYRRSGPHRRGWEPISAEPLHKALIERIRQELTRSQ